MPKTYNDIFIKVRRELKAAEIEGYGLEARLLVSSAADKTREEFARDMKLYVNKGFEEKVDALLSRRLAGEPLAYIIGSWEFYGIPIEVTRDVLIPRIDTEILVSQAIAMAKWLPAGSRVLDLCCGSGCVGLAIAKNVPQVKVVLADISPEAMKVSRANVVLNKLTGRVTCAIVDARRSPPYSLLGEFDLIVSNPPYIPTDDISWLDDTVRNHEPILALDGGADGLDFYRVIVAEWKKILKPEGAFLFEVGIDQAADVADVLIQNGMNRIIRCRDTLGIERVVVGQFDKAGEVTRVSNPEQTR
ncbi:MAG: peptide chain release factor N(5)-glutamine methyltransferase [Oscillospiraceae bacterium]|nr:peptide chain release factor N(5)-glutamine methyltransferase [Oscillospiraceae bacterium]